MSDFTGGQVNGDGPVSRFFKVRHNSVPVPGGAARSRDENEGPLAAMSVCSHGPNLGLDDPEMQPVEVDSLA